MNKPPSLESLIYETSNNSDTVAVLAQGLGTVPELKFFVGNIFKGDPSLFLHG